MKAWEKMSEQWYRMYGEQPNQIRMIKLNTNENPYPPAPGVQEAIKSLDDKKDASLSGSDRRSAGE